MIERSPIEPGISYEGPIIACIGEKKDFLEQSSFLRSWKYDENNHNVDYYATSAELNRAAMQNSGELTYVISPIDGQNKFSNGFANCTGIIAVGFSKEKGHNISVMTHQDPDAFLTTHADKFTQDLEQTLHSLLLQADSGSVDIVIFGGNSLSDSQLISKAESESNYQKSIEILKRTVEKVTNTEPVIISGPKLQSGGEDVYFETQSRRLFLIKPDTIQQSQNKKPHEPEEIQDGIY